jgi:hypothetical protein
MGRHRVQSRDLGVFNEEKKIPRMVFGIPIPSEVSEVLNR